MGTRLRRWDFIGILALAFLLAGAAVCGADEIVLENGNVLTGTVEKVEKDTLILKTDFSPNPIEIQVAKIKKITTDNPVEIHLATGEILKGKLKTTETGRLAIETSPERGTTQVDWKEVTAVNPPPKPPVKLTGSITLGGSNQSGNTDRTSVAAGVDASLKMDRSRFSLRGLYNYAKEKGQETANNAYGLMKYDYFFTQKFYGYLAVDVLKDRFKDLDLRTTIGPGVGYQFWDDPVKFLLLEGGVAYRSENHIAGTDRETVTARLAGNFRYKLFEFLIFGERLEVFPNLNYGGEFTLRNEADIQTPIGAGWSLKLSNIIEYDTDPTPGFKNTDVMWILGLQYAF